MTDDADPGAPIPLRVISDVDTLRALSDPVRLRILELMVGRHRETWTVKRLAGELGMGPTKLYHHVKVLEERGLIRAAGTRVVSGIIETSYRTAQLSLQLDRGLIAEGAVPPAVDELLRNVLDGVRLAIEAGIRSGAVLQGADADPPRRLLLSRGLIRVPAARAAEIHDRFRTFVEGLDDLGEDDPDAVSLGFVVGLYPLANDTTEETDR
jgi:DNA-binding transcriptional ArsR family regulator